MSRRSDITSVSHANLLPGTRLGNYEIKEPCGEGGFAVVYRAIHNKLHRPAAIKVLHAKLVHRADLVTRFEQEAQMITKIQHPNIVHIYDFGTLDDGRPYFAMEWLEGKSLAQELRARGKFDQQQVLQLAEEIGAGLSVIHAAGVVHRDLKTNNIVVVATAGQLRVKLLDFGIAKFLEGDTGLSLPGMMLGTPETMSPEQIQGRPVGAETDVYSFGVLLYQLTTGRLPFTASTDDEVHRLQCTAPRPDCSEYADVSSHYDNVVKRCMAIDRSQRYQSVADVLADLRLSVRLNPATAMSVAVGSVIGDSYRLTEIIGQGGMGTVFAGQHLRLPQRVAVKVISGIVDRDSFARFRREAEIASSLGHANIVRVIDFNTLPDGVPYMVMEYIDGSSLASVIDAGPLETGRVLSIARQAGSALQAAHSENVVHRDLKPSNVFLSLREVAGAIVEHVTILDFGVSKIHNSNTVSTETRALVGTPRYMAPEQALGEANIDGRSDQFALAVLAYEMLTGRPAFAGERLAEIVYKVVHAEPTPIATLLPKLDVRIVNAIERAMNKKPAQRFASIAEFVEELSGAPLQQLPRTPVWPRDTPAERMKLPSGVQSARAPASNTAASDSKVTVVARRREPDALDSQPEPIGPRVATGTHRTRPTKSKVWVAMAGLALFAAAAAALYLWTEKSDKVVSVQPVASSAPPSSTDSPAKVAIAAADASVAVAAADASVAAVAAPSANSSTKTPPPSQPNDKRVGAANELPRNSTPANDTKSVKRSETPPEVLADLVAAEKALRAGQFSTAQDLARRSMRTQITPRAYEVLVLSYCGVGDFGSARDYLSNVAASTRNRVIRACKRDYNIDLAQ